MSHIIEPNKRDMNYQETYYSREWVHQNIKKYFNIKELVSKAVLRRFGEAQCWSFFDFTMLSNLLYIRENRGFPITINNDRWQQRGLRENTCELVKAKTDAGRIYVSGHILGSAVDFHEATSGFTAVEIRNWIVDNAEGIPYKCRLERRLNGKIINWVHMDTAYFKDYDKVHQFDM